MNLDPSGSTPSAISTVHDDIILTQILTRLDGPSLASTSCTSSHLHSLINSNPMLWTDVCHSTWPSTSSPRVTGVISSFPDGHRSFFSDSYPLLLSDGTTADPSYIHPSSELISAVDLFYNGRLILSRVIETETTTAWFGSSPFRIDVLNPKEAAPEAVQTKAMTSLSSTCQDLSEGMRLSWIVIDPESRRAMNVSSGRPVEVQRHWLTGDMRVKFATTVGGEEDGVQCGIVVTCVEGEEEGGVRVRVREVSMQVEDVEGVVMNGRGSLGILGRVMEGKRGRRKGGEGEGKRRYDEFERRKREKKEMRLRREGRLDVVCVGMGVLSYVVFLGFVCLCSR